MIAKTILAQLGGNKFVAMTGAKNLVDTGNGLMFSLPSRFAKNGINKVVITLTPADEYDMEFYKLRGVKCDLVDKIEGVYCDQLQGIFKSYTGLDTHL